MSLQGLERWILLELLLKNSSLSIRFEVTVKPPCSHPGRCVYALAALARGSTDDGLPVNAIVSVSRGLEDAAASLKRIAPAPHYALVDAPGCLSGVARNDTFGIAFGCRGIVAFDVAYAFGTKRPSGPSNLGLPGSRQSGRRVS